MKGDDDDDNDESDDENNDNADDGNEETYLGLPPRVFVSTPILLLKLL